MRRGLLLIVVAGCGFELAPGAPGGDPGSGPDAAVSVDASPDATVAPLPLFAASNQMLHELDVDAKTTRLVGPIAQGGGTPIDVDGLALHGAMLIGLDSISMESSPAVPWTRSVPSTNDMDIIRRTSSCSIIMLIFVSFPRFHQAHQCNA